MPACTETVEEIIRQRQRIIGIFGMHAQTARHQKPVEIRTDHQADGNPSLVQAAQINRPGQPHQQPARHIRSPRRHRRYKRAETAAAENIVAEIARRKISGQTDKQDRYEIKAKRNVHRIHADTPQIELT